MRITITIGSSTETEFPLAKINSPRQRPSSLMKSKLLLSLAISSAAVIVFAAEPPAGIKPLDSDGRPLNFDFESGTLKDWTATGTAFEKQPVKGDLVAARRKDMKSEHQGQFWIGGFEGTSDEATGRLTSMPFKVTHSYGSFLMGGGATDKTRVELVLKNGATEKVIYAFSGVEQENLRRAIVDLQLYLGKEIFIRVVDDSKDPWGHVNFDDFVFHASKPQFTNAIDTTKKASVVLIPPTDDVKFSGLTAEQAAKEMTLPKGFKATLFAGEPDVQQPIAFCIDDRGRLWVVEGYTYPKRKGTPPAPMSADGKPSKEQLADILGSNDRILVFEDTDNDGKFDKRSVFLDKLNLVSGIEVGFGGVWIGAAPYLMFVPVKDWDSPKPAGDPQVLLDGWDYTRDTHETLNTFTWGPDGWLYGCHGVFCPSNVGKPGAAKTERQWVDAAVWRYHPTKHQFEVFAEGTSNPWGVDFDENGQCFIEACVIPHLFHMIQGARYHRQGGAHYAANAEETRRFAERKEGKSDKTLNPFIYDDIKTIADHVHYAGTKGPHAGNGRSDAMGGGHAHAGLLVYQGDSFPAEYRGKLFMNNIHGQRINMDIPERVGSGFVGRHGADFINFNDRWSQVLNLLTGPDGSVFMIDWYDKNQCHHNDVNGHDRANGRIFKISYGAAKPVKVDLQKLSDEELVTLIASKNSWHARHAQRILQERAAEITKVIFSAASDPSVENSPEFKAAVGRIDNIGMELLPMLNGSGSSAEKLRALWTLHVTAAKQTQWRLAALAHEDELVRCWAIQLLFEAAPTVQPNFLLSAAGPKPSGPLGRGWNGKTLAQMAGADSSPMLRLYIASALQRVKPQDRVETLEALLAHAEDAGDHNLPLMYWYAAEAVAGKDVATAAKLLAKTKIPQVREYITRRMTAGAAKTAAN
jgi:putative membrane-bound dehydrogenase-like protein